MAKRRKHGIAGKNLVGFEVAGVAYALDIACVREILRPLPTLSLPHVPDTVVGVVDHRGDVIPVIDLRRRFGVLASGRDRDQRWIIVSRAEMRIGLVVDRLTEVFGVEEASARELPKLGIGDKVRGIKAAYSHAGQLVFVLDVDELTDVAEALALPDLADLQSGVVRDG
jgi:purine-binding chemotaxis protein CheW